MITRWFSRPTPHPEPDLPMAKHSEIHWFWVDFSRVWPSPHGRIALKWSLERFYASYASSKMFCEPCTMWNHFFSYTLDGFSGRPIIQNEFSQWLIHSEILWCWQNFIEISPFIFFQTEFVKKTPDLSVSNFPKNFWKYKQNRRLCFFWKKIFMIEPGGLVLRIPHIYKNPPLLLPLF